MVPRQVIVLAVFRIEPKVDIKFLSDFRGQICKWLRPAAVRGCRPLDDLLVIT